MALLFQRPRRGWREQVEALANEAADPELCAAAVLAVRHAGEGAYHTLFGPGGPAPPREVTYRESLQSGATLAQVSAYYDAFSYQPGAEEPPDHVSVEADFVAYLRLKEAYALARGDSEQAALTSEAAGRFIDDHLAVIAGPLAQTLASSDVEYLKRAGKALQERTQKGSREIPGGARRQAAGRARWPSAPF
jgi:TorA maturation chaperone TorD